MKNLQTEHKIWVNKKYPNQSAKLPAVGCLEEAGELVHGILKTEQVQIWGEDSRHKLAELRVKILDAIGDCGIYACSLCNATDVDFEGEWTTASQVVYIESNALNAAIKLVQIATNVALNPYKVTLLNCYLQQLIATSRCLGLDAEIAIKKTWLTVKER